MKLFLRLISYSKQFWPRLLIAALASLGAGAMEGTFAWLVEPLLKRVFAEKQLDVLTLLPFGIVFIFLCRGLFRFLNDYFMSTAGQLAIQQIRNEVYEKCMRLSIGFFNKQSTGILMSRILNDVGSMQGGVANIVTGLFRDGFSIVALLCVIFYRNWQLAIISFMVIPATILPAICASTRARRQHPQPTGTIPLAY